MVEESYQKKYWVFKESNKFLLKFIGFLWKLAIFVEGYNIPKGMNISFESLTNIIIDITVRSLISTFHQTLFGRKDHYEQS